MYVVFFKYCFFLNMRQQKKRIYHILFFSNDLFNSFSQIVGFTSLALFIWVLTDPSMLITMTQERNHFYIGLYVFLIVGLLMLVVAILGCCGSLRESKCMLIGVSREDQMCLYYYYQMYNEYIIFSFYCIILLLFLMCN